VKIFARLSCFFFGTLTACMLGSQVLTVSLNPFVAYVERIVGTWIHYPLLIFLIFSTLMMACIGIYALFMKFADSADSSK
jgi:hypothetical protein